MDNIIGKFKSGLISLAVVVISSIVIQSASATPVYMRSTVGAPWGQNTNETAMDTVFGNGNWDDLRYETVNVASLFSASNEFIYMEGSDDNADELETFLTTNLVAMQDWVSAGGRLFINAAPNEGDGMDFGFGITLNFMDDFSLASDAVNAVDPAHPIFNGPYGATGTAFTGNWFGHATVSGVGLTALIEDSVSFDAVLGELTYGSGLVLAGGMTTTNWHDPNPQAATLRANIIAYTARTGLTDVPEPAPLALLGLGLLGLGLARRRRG